ncbi:aldo/keto reductase [Clostridium sp. DL-VIII]|uniref:aldo/keto reductase n=1 Tax=Clostridium sp. DL-VIII TaxID=641107 RepID=UPI00023B0041|nr:aldo/keto reductase [Clostridium sp. DL-VIII]
MKRLGFGFMRLPLLDEQDRSKVDLEQVKKMVDIYMERDFSYFDTAHRYHDEMSEPTLREALVKRYPRESYVLTNKITLNYIKKSEDQGLFFQKQLKICGVDYFDNYLVHNMGNNWYKYAKKLGTFEFLQRMKEKGLVKQTGFSFHDTPEVLDEILNDHPEIDIVQLQINYLDWEDGGIQSKKCYEIARKHGKSIVVMEPIKGGNLIQVPDEVKTLLNAYDPEASLASWAIRFAASHEGIFTVLSGMSSLEQLEDNTRCMQDFKLLTNEEFELLKKAADIIRSNTVIGCTNCRYCTTECPKSIAIPDYFAIYNNMKRLDNVGYVVNQKNYYMNLIQTYGKASNCIKCGICEKNCPQHLKIRNLLEDIAEAFENTEKLKYTNTNIVN